MVANFVGGRRGDQRPRPTGGRHRHGRRRRRRHRSRRTRSCGGSGAAAPSRARRNGQSRRDCRDDACRSRRGPRHRCRRRVRTGFEWSTRARDRRDGHRQHHGSSRRDRVADRTPTRAGHGTRHRHRRRATREEDRGRRSSRRALSPSSARRPRVRTGGGRRARDRCARRFHRRGRVAPGPGRGRRRDRRRRARSPRSQTATWCFPMSSPATARPNPVRPWCCEHLGLEPVIDLGLRLGEGSGACLALGVLEASARILNEMATFDAVGITNKD